MKRKIITIDGPAGSGKSTVSRMVAQKMKWIHFNSGALYRSLAYLFLESGKPEFVMDDYKDILIQGFNQNKETGKIFIGDKEITNVIRSSSVSQTASEIAQKKEVRDALLSVQRSIVTNLDGSVVDGRDMGTVVFPEAFLKVFLTASVMSRAKRRFLELQKLGENSSVESLAQEIETRDIRDANRDVAPMQPAFDAIELDSTYLSPEDVVEIIYSLALQRNLS